MERKQMLPVGIDQFEKLRHAGFYYVDKTKLLEQLLENWAEVNLCTRPRRFGKTLNMSMLRCFLEIGADSALFDGLYISTKQELCRMHMGKYPVIFLSLKDVDGLSYSEAQAAMMQLIGYEASRFSFLESSSKLSGIEKEQYRGLTVIRDGKYQIDPGVLVSSLKLLSRLLYRHYGQKAVILIDEYDVPLDKAFQHGYYMEMVSLVRGLFSQALKSNEYLQFSVLTGCLRVSKESIFTGLNNFRVLSVTDTLFEEQFGFTDAEVRQMLDYYDQKEHYEEIKEWYDGYRFGNADIYCPWDVVNYVGKLVTDPEAEPEDFWINSSGNALVKRFVDKADQTTRDEIEQLIAGEAIEKRIRMDLTYDEIDNSINNIWSVLFTTGYLTQTERAKNGIYKLAIPNREVREVFVYQIQQWFEQSVAKKQNTVNELHDLMMAGKSEELQMKLLRVLSQTISILDTKARDEQKENFYHGLLLGLFRNYPDWTVKSNVESGDGFADIIIKPEEPEKGIIIELKYAQTVNSLEKACENAIVQIRERRYDELLREEGRNDILIYGIAFCKKRCKVVVDRL